jgi:hypothetical protein
MGSRGQRNVHHSGFSTHEQDLQDPSLGPFLLLKRSRMSKGRKVTNLPLAKRYTTSDVAHVIPDQARLPMNNFRLLDI